MPSVMRTLLFKIHNPSRRTAATLHRVLVQYTAGARVLLDGAAHDWEAVRADSAPPNRPNAPLSPLRVAQVLRRRYGARVAPYALHSSLREALYADIAAAITSYDALTRNWLAARERARERIAAQGWTIDPLNPRAEALLAALGAPPSWPSVPRTRPHPSAYEDALMRLTDLPVMREAPPERQDAPRLTKATRRLRALLDCDVQPQRQEPRPRTMADAVDHGTRPLFFARPDGVGHNRNFSLVVSDDRTLYALLYLLPGDSPRRRPLLLPHAAPEAQPDAPARRYPTARDDSARTRRLVARVGRRWARGGAPPPRAQRVPQRVPQRGALRGLHAADTTEERTLRAASKSSSAVLAPLECGKWHMRTAVSFAIERPEMVRSARLIHRPARKTIGGAPRPDAYYLAVTFEHETPEPRIIRTHMGVSLDDNSRLAWVVRDAASGLPVDTGTDDRLYGLQEQWRQDRRMHMRQGRIPPRAHHLQSLQVKQVMHCIVNDLVEIASRHDAQIALQDVTYLRHKRSYQERDETGAAAARGVGYHEALADQQYRRATLIGGALLSTLGYKAPRMGLPRPLSISGISPRDCAACSQRGTERELCSLCGAPLDVRNAATVTVLRITPTLDRIRAARARRAAVDDARADDARADDALDGHGNGERERGTGTGNGNGERKRGTGNENGG